MKAQSFSSFGVDPHKGVRTRSAKQFVVGETVTLKYVKEIAFFPRPPKLRVSIAYCGLSSMLTLRPVKAVALPVALVEATTAQIPAAVSPRIRSPAAVDRCNFAVLSDPGRRVAENQESRK